MFLYLYVLKYNYEKWRKIKIYTGLLTQVIVSCAGEDVDAYGKELEGRQEKKQRLYYKSHYGLEDSICVKISICAHA